MSPKKSSHKRVSKREKQIELKLSFAAEAWIAFENAELLPLEEYVDTNQKWKSKCLVCGTIVAPRVADIKHGRKGCKTCAVEKRTGQNSKHYPKQEKKALSIAKNANLEPLEPYKNARTKWKCKCLKCGEIVTPTFHNLEQGNGGCLNCQEYSFQPNQPSYLYVMMHKHMGSLKVGVGNQDNKTDRIETHKRFGWELLQKYDFKLGKDATIVEVKLLKWLRQDLKLPPHLSKDLMKQFGYSETVDLEEIDIPKLLVKISQIIKGLQE
jgi:hypothetical protein